MGKGLQKVFKIIVKEIFARFTFVIIWFRISHLITEPRNLVTVTQLSYDRNKPWLKETQKDIKKII